MESRQRSAGYPVLRGRIKADVAVAGGGLTGLTTALWLSRAGLKVVVAEAERIGYGASGDCCGVLSPAHGLLYAGLEKKHGGRAAHAYAQTHLKAIQSIYELNAKQGLRFAMQKIRGAIIPAEGKTERLEEEAEAMKRSGIAAEIQSGAELPLSVSNALSIQPVYLLDSRAYLQALAAQAGLYGAQCFEKSRIIGVEADTVHTEQGSIQAPFIVIATGYPIVNTPGWFFIRMEQHKRAVFRMSGMQAHHAVFFSADHSYTCLPEGSDVLLQIRENPVGAEKVAGQERMVKNWARRIGATAIEQIRTGIETGTPDGLAYIGPYSSKTPSLFVGTGYGGDGLAGSMIAAQAITARILGLPSEGYEIYLPQRGMGGMAVPAQIAGRYLRGMFGGTEAPRCSHMGCKLVYHPVSRLWECPCHGSRFDDIGRVVNAPATRPALLKGRK